ncbi:MAG: A/G-specific adenine glycosylase [Bacteroidota bacterium]
MGFSNRLIYWYLKNKRDLPWRKGNNVYHIWLSEIILQQTRIEQGTNYYLKFCENFPTIFDLAETSEERVLKLWQGLGYYSRARNLHFTAKFIVENYNGEIPNNYNDLIKLKGIGDYTASAIASICFNEPKAVVDGNVYRVLSRYYNICTPINSLKGVKQFKQIAQEIIYKEDPGTYNQAIMELGALICKPKKAECNNCPIQKGCNAYLNQNVYSFPVKEKKIRIKKRFFNFLVFDITGHRTILEKRQEKDIWQNLYQFPLVESENEVDEFKLSEAKVLKDLIKEYEYEIALFNSKPILHKLTHQHILIKFWIIKPNSDLEGAIEWKDVSNFAVPVPVHNFIENFRK